MDIITRLKEALRKIYSNKAFRTVFFLFFLLVVAYKYSNIKTGIRNLSSNPEAIEGMNIPKKINVIKNMQDTFTTEVDTRNQEKQDRQEKLEKLKKIEEEKARNEEIKEKKIAKLKKEFTSKTNKNSYVLKAGDVANTKMIITNGDDYNANMDPIDLPIRVNNDRNNMFGRKLIGKKVGQVVLIPFKDFLEDQSFKDTLEKVKKEQNISDSDFNFDVLKNSNVIYRIKILNIMPKE